MSCSRTKFPPSFPDELALKVMVTGKSINFLKEKCQEHKLDSVFNLSDTLKEAGR